MMVVVVEVLEKPCNFVVVRIMIIKKKDDQNLKFVVVVVENGFRHEHKMQRQVEIWTC